MDATTVEVERVRHHIERAALRAAGRDTSRLSRVQRIVRQLLLRALEAYRADGRFPINRDFAEQTPYFVDAAGTRCAMAHLLELGGERALVDKIARERNNAYVRELADEARLLAWLRAAGLTVEEAAAIQPAYCADEMSDCICGGTFSATDYPVPARGVLEGVVQANGMVRVERTYGDAFGVAVGTEVAVARTYASGTRVLAPIEGAAPEYGYGSIELDANGNYECSSQAIADAPAIGSADFIAAVLANDCRGALYDADPVWAEEPDCEGGFEEGPIDGCSAGGGQALSSVGILLALVTVLARRR
jgi:hypothetical protein